MQRRAFILGIAGAAVAGIQASADPASQVVAQLVQQGFVDIKEYKTWLGRVRIVAHRQGGTREIVLNPRTGEILRDLWTPAKGSGTVSVIDSVNSSHSGSGSRTSSTGGSSGGTSGGSSTGGGGSGGTSGGTSGGGDSGGGSDGGSSGSGGDSKDSTDN